MSEYGIVFDIETAEAELLDQYGPGFVRLCGWMRVGRLGQPFGDVVISTDPAELVAELHNALFVSGHNILEFDLRALAVHEGLDYERVSKRSFDTILVERHVTPVAAKGMQRQGFYSLDQTAARYGVAGKSHVDYEGKMAIVRRIRGDKYADQQIRNHDRAAAKAAAKCAGLGIEPPAEKNEFPVLRLLADQYGGFGKIPQDDPDYREYLRRDVLASAGLYREHLRTLTLSSEKDRAYVRREHYNTASLYHSVTITGMRVDTDLTMTRWAEGQARLEAGKQMMAEKHGMPTEGKKPHTTNPGKAAVRAAMLAALRCTDEQLDRNWPLNKDGSLSTAKDVLNGMVERFETIRPEAAELCRTILQMNGERTVYGTVLHWLTGDRVHPRITASQSTGRWSMTDPGLTVLGKRGGKARERAMMLADNDDEVLVAIDADQVDARVVAAECQDPAYMALFAPGMDLHSEVAFRVWPNPEQHGTACHRLGNTDCGCGYNAKCHCEKRDQAKVFGHGFSYGLGAKGMAAQHGVDVEVALNFVRGMTEAFPRLAEWKDEVRAAAGVLQYGEEAPANDSYRVLRTWAGRPVRVERNRAYTQATASIGQGGTRDVMAEAILSMPPFYRRRIRAVVHDEIVVSLPKEDAQAKAQQLADSMAFDLKGVRITFGCSRVARSWAGCYGAEYEEAA